MTWKKEGIASKWTGARGYRWIFILYLYGGYATIILCENSLDGFFLNQIQWHCIQCTLGALEP